MKRILLIAAFCIIGIVHTTLAVAANHYIRAGANGNNSGSDWTNAMPSFPSNFVRGDTYYVADGNYGSVTLDTSASGESYIFIKKAISSSHGTDTGWQTAYGDGQAVFSHISVESTHWDLDGQVGSGTSGYGFVVVVTTTGQTYAVHLLGNPSPGYFRMKHFEVYSTQLCSVPADVKQRGFYSLSPSGPVYIGYSYFHHWKKSALLLTNDNGTIIEHNYFDTTLSYASSHGQTIQFGPGNSRNADVRYNVFKNGHGTGFVVYLDGTYDNIDTYGNIFWSTEAAPCGDSWTSQAVGHTSRDSSSNCDVHNNTFVGMNKINIQAQIDHSTYGTGNKAYNNLYYESIASYVNTDNAYNTTAVSDPFTDSAGGDFTLASNTSPGTPLEAKFSIDMNGNQRTTWSRGALEYNGTGGSTTPPVTDDPSTLENPTGLIAYPVGIEVASVSASTDDGNVPENTLDTNILTRWSAYGVGQWIEYDLGSSKDVSCIYISFYLGDERTSDFSVQVSQDQLTWTEVYSGTSSGTSNMQERYNFSSNVTARYVRIVGNGNSSNEWNSVSEVDIL